MRTLALALALFACNPSAESDTDAAAEPSECALATGTYAASGSCFGMDMTATLTFDDACAFTIGAWDMNHTGLPETGTIAGDAVTLAGGNFDGCTGAVDGGTLEGTCADGCTWSFTAETE